MKSIGVFTKNFKLYYELLKVLRKRKIPYVSLNSPKNIPSKIGVILTSHNEIHDIKSQKVIAVDAYDTIDHGVDLAIQLLIGKELYSKVYIGIDPGEKPGIAVVGDDILLQKISVETPENVENVVKRIINEYPSNEILIRIGHGSPIIRNRIINSLIPLGISIEIVDESKTTPQQQLRKNEKDTEAAAAIALISGGKVQRKLPLDPTKGEIKNLQEKSRKLSDGEYTISENTAIRVLKGEISLEYAIEKEKVLKTNKRKTFTKPKRL